MKKGSMVLLAIGIVLVFLASVFVVAETPKTSEEVIITASDLPYQGWMPRSPSFIPGAIWDIPIDPKDWSELQINHYPEPNGTEVPAGTNVYVLHLGSTNDARTDYEGITQAHHFSYGNESIPIGEETLIFPRNSTGVTGVSFEDVIFMRGNYLVWMQFAWLNSFAWSEGNSLKVAQIQADKIP